MNEIAYLLIALLCAYALYGYARVRPEDFSAASVNKSMYVLALLAVVLILFLGMVITLLRL